MTDEEKQLFLKDLCARFPYEVRGINSGRPETIVNISILGYYKNKSRDGWHHIEDFKPYLRPKSSMTEEEVKTYRTLQSTACSYHYEFGDIVDDILYFDNDTSLDYLNSIHVDFRDLIPKGLALEAPENMYKTE